MRIQSKNGRGNCKRPNAVGFCFEFDWLRGWRDFPKPIMQQNQRNSRLLTTFGIETWSVVIFEMRTIQRFTGHLLGKSFHRLSTKFSSVLPCCLLKVPKVLNLPLNDLETVSEDSLVSCNPSDSFCCSVVAIVSFFSRLLSAFLSSSWNILKAPKDSSSG